MARIGFDNQKYIEMQSAHIRDRIAQFGGKLYLEFGGKLFDDYHASRVLPGFEPDSKIRMLQTLRDDVEVLLVINASDIEKNKVRGDLGIPYEDDVLRLMTSGDYGRYTDSRSKNLQLCFVTDNDITGGNSGSPMFNGKGELVGLAFDGNWESMANDLQYSTELTRCIGVDIRYVMYVIDRWAKADRLMKEISLAR